MAQDERRTGERAGVDIGIRVTSESVEEFVDRYIRDISSGGVFIEMAVPMPVGTTVDFELKIGDDTPLISGQGMVAWQRSDRTDTSPPGVGVKFSSLSPDGQTLVDVFVEQRVGDEGRFDKKR